MLERILAPLDGSPLAESALPHVEALAATFGSEIHLLTVTEPPPRQREVDSADWRMAVAAARGYLNRLANDLHRSGLTAEVHVLEGSAPGRVLDFARSRRTDLLVLSRSARGGAGDFPMSGTAFKIVRAAPCSILLTGADARPGTTARYRRILAPVDCSVRSGWVVSLAAAIAASSGAELVLVTVVPAPDVLGEPAEWSEQARLAKRLTELNRETAEAHLEGLLHTLAALEVPVRTRVVSDSDPGRALCRLEEEEEASLMVISAHGRTGDTEWRYGAVAMRLVHHATRPLLVLQDVTEARGRWSGRRRSRAAREGSSR